MFHVALTADFFDTHGKLKYADVGLSTFDGHSQIAVCQFADHRPIIGADQLRGANGVIVMTPRVTRESLAEADDLLSVGRFGVGYDSVDVEACTAADVLVVITIGAVDRSVAEATIGWMLALSLHVRVKDRLAREAQWEDRGRYMGRELRDRTLGIVGMGGIGRQLVKLLANWSLREIVAFDPFLDPATAAELRVRLVPLEELLRSSDIVTIHCPLNDKTRGLIGARELGLMKPGSYLINTARGGIVDEDALYLALKEFRLAGAAIDCFVEEPYSEPSRFGEFENVLLAPHCIAWTNEIFRDMGRAACQGMLDLSLGRRPRGIVNPQVFESSGFQRKWERICGRVGEVGK